MNAVEIEEAVSDLVFQPFDRAEFPFQFLEAFGNKETTLKRLHSGSSNRSDVDGAVLQRTNIHILATEPGETESGLKALRLSPKTAQQKAKFILATDGTEIQAEDLNSGEVLACASTDLPTHFGFLLPLAGITTVSEIKNNPIDIKATGRLDKLYVALLQDERNNDWAQEKNRERFNHFMAQLIFCFFAEDTGIFRGDNHFSLTVQRMSDSDGSNTQEIITNCFAAMNLDPRKGERKNVRPYTNEFPYVNGGLFGGPDDGSKVHVPIFNKMARTYLLRAGDLDWTAINPDIFGSIIQAVADDEERGELGMHYTSVPNILKVLNPLFLDSLNTYLEKAGNNKQQLGKLKKRIARIRVFDPACGSGNFLVIAYKRMREIEHRANCAAGWETEKSVIPLTNYRGIEIKGFAAEIARLALIIAEYQCDELYMGQREALALFLPLEKTNWITCGNALRLDWLSICPPTGETSVKLHGDDLFNTPIDQSEIDFENEGGETYICGNPPYLGSTWQSKAQKDDLKQIFDGRTNSWKSLDYVAGWFMKGADYFTHTEGTAAFVSTNSICQGQQVPILWPLIFLTGSEIVFAHTSFKWNNLASHNAGVTVVVVGLSRSFDGDKRIIEPANDNEVSDRIVHNINAYLVAAKNVIINKSSKPKTGLSEMSLGNKPVDGGNLLLKREEKSALGLSNSQEDKFIRRIYGSAEFIQGKERFCLWITEDEKSEALKISSIAKRVEYVRQMRLGSRDKSANAMAKISHQMREMNIGKTHTLVAPSVSSETREYLPIGIIDHHSTVTTLAFALYDAPIWNMALIASRIHLVWIANVCGKLKTDFRYSNTMGWNTFPVPTLTEKNKADLTACAENLRAAHEENDRILEEIYIGRRFKNDTERLEKLFEMYTEMTTKVGV